jgi:hypothetical protein
MTCTLPVDYVKVKGAEVGNPPSDHAFSISKVDQPPKGTMVSSDGESPPRQIVFEMFNK